MEFKEIQSNVIKNAKDYGKEFDVEIDEDYALLKLYEEAGELAQAVLIHRKKSRPSKHLPKEESKVKVAEELADVIGFTIVVADLLGIDLEDIVTKKWLNRKEYHSK
jgi:NTP pyrophosphatase (non-canonical NTP hydrolase)